MYDAFIIILIVVGVLLIMATPATNLYFRYLKATIKPNRPRGSAYTAHEMHEKTLRNRAITERENSIAVLRLKHRTMTFGILSALIAFLLTLLR